MVEKRVFFYPEVVQEDDVTIEATDPIPTPITPTTIPPRTSPKPPLSTSVVPHLPQSASDTPSEIPHGNSNSEPVPSIVLSSRNSGPTIAAGSNPLKRKREAPEKRVGPLDKWCFPVTAEVARLNQETLDRLHRETMEERREKDDAIESRAKRRKREGATERKQRERERKKEAEISSGHRDSDGKVIPKNRVVPVALAMPPPGTLNVAEVSRPLRTANEYDRQQRGVPGRPRTKSYKPAVLVNWTSPLLWEQIDKYAQRNMPQMSDLKRNALSLFLFP
jgi:hypothetical protein